jgi:hypothetical protein
MCAAELCANLKALNAMNTDSTNPQLEARWKTYAKAAIAMVPAVVACLMARTFIVPKVEQIWADAGLAGGGAMAAALVVLRNVMPAVCFAAFILLLVEWRWRTGARFRGALVTAVVFLMNAAAFFGIGALCVAGVLGAAEFHGKMRSAGVVAESGAGLQPAIVRYDGLQSRPTF